MCKSCHRRFCEGAKSSEELQDDVVEAYLFDVKSLDRLIRTRFLKIPRTTLFRKINKKASECPDWPELLSTMKDNGVVGAFMGVDTTTIKIKTKYYVYFHAVDIASGNPIAYALCKNKDSTTIEPILQKLKHKGYIPKIVVTDLASELIASITKVFPDAIIQGCLFHLKMWLDEELPTKRRIKGINDQTVTLWLVVKKLVLCVAYSKDWETRRKYLAQLNNLNLDEKAKSVVKRFSDNLVYYNTLDKLRNYTTNLNQLLYNNTCECHIGLVKALESKMRSFKNIDSAKAYIKLYWFFYLKRKKQELHSPEDKTKLVYTTPLPLFDHVNLEEFSTMSGFPQEMLERALKEKGYEIINGQAFTQAQLEEIKKEVVKMRNMTFANMAKTLGYDIWTVLNILQRIGIKISYTRLDLSDAALLFKTSQDSQEKNER